LLSAEQLLQFLSLSAKTICINNLSHLPKKVNSCSHYIKLVQLKIHRFRNENPAKLLIVRGIAESQAPQSRVSAKKKLVCSNSWKSSPLVLYSNRMRLGQRQFKQVLDQLTCEQMATLFFSTVFIKDLKTEQNRKIKWQNNPYS